MFHLGSMSSPVKNNQIKISQQHRGMCKHSPKLQMFGIKNNHIQTWSSHNFKGSHASMPFNQSFQKYAILKACTENFMPKRGFRSPPPPTRYTTSRFMLSAVLPQFIHHIWESCSACPAISRGCAFAFCFYLGAATLFHLLSSKFVQMKKTQKSACTHPNYFLDHSKQGPKQVHTLLGFIHHIVLLVYYIV